MRHQDFQAAPDTPVRKGVASAVGGKPRGKHAPGAAHLRPVKVLVLEKRHILGGAACSEEIYPGFTYSVCSYVVSLLRPQIIRDLQLSRFGLSVLLLESTFTPYPDGRSLMRSADPAATRREIASFSARDADVYSIFGKAMGQLARFTKPIIDEKAPNPMSWKPAELMQLLKMEE